MKKNIIFIVVDSLYLKCLGEHYGQTTTPYLDELKKKSIYYTQLFSQGPFTEAALMPLVTGNYTLAYGGYINKFENSPYTIYQEFFHNGYDVFHNFHPNNYNIDKLSEMNNGYFLMGFDFNIVWAYRLEYFVSKKRTSSLEDIDYYNIEKNLLLGINSSISFYNHLLKKDAYTNLIDEKSYESVDIGKNITLLESELKSLMNHSRVYIDDFLEKGKNHNLFKMDVVMQESVIHSNAWFKIVKNEYDSFLKESNALEKKLNKRNNSINYATIRNKLFLAFYKRNFEYIKDILRYLRNYRTMLSRNEFDNLQKNDIFEKAMPSMQTTFNFFEDWLDNRESEKPFFAKIHVDDCHYKSSFFSYDCLDKNQIENEFKLLKNYMNHLSNDYKGSLSYDYSLLYMDNCVKNLVTSLEAKGKMENTVLIFTADHGYSYSYKPVRESYVSNFYTENYNVPFLIYNSGLENEINNELYSSIDVLPTLLELASCESQFKKYPGYSMLHHNERKNIVIEYMGAGCPDISARPLKICIRNKEYVLVYEGSINSDFSETNFIELYDLKNDKDMSKNIIYKYDVYRESLNEMISLCKDRLMSISEDYHNIINKISK